MTIVFVSGSRRVSRINDMIRDRIRNMIDQDFRIVVGDANGADKALQKFLAEMQYSNVIVFFSGKTCRNNIGEWDTRQITVDPSLKGRAFYTQKDKAMAAEADYGFVLWDGKSAGSISNVFELLKHGKKIVVYFAPEKQFLTVSSLDDAKELLSKCDPDTFDSISKKINLPSVFAGVQNGVQGSEALCVLGPHFIEVAVLL